MDERVIPTTSRNFNFNPAVLREKELKISKAVRYKYTKSRRPVKLVRKQKTEKKVSAMQLEYKIKRMPKEKKQEIINTRIKVIFSEKSLPKTKVEKRQFFAK